jgi:hypothetical protein
MVFESQRFKLKEIDLDLDIMGKTIQDINQNKGKVNPEGGWFPMLINGRMFFHDPVFCEDGEVVEYIWRNDIDRPIQHIRFEFGGHLDMTKRKPIDVSQSRFVREFGWWTKNLPEVELISRHDEFVSNNTPININNKILKVPIIENHK